MFPVGLRRVIFVVLSLVLVLQAAPAAAEDPTEDADATEQPATVPVELFTGNLRLLLEVISEERGATGIVSVDQVTGDILRPTPTSKDIAFFAYDVTDSIGTYQGFIGVDRETDVTTVLATLGDEVVFKIFDGQFDGEAPTALIPNISITAGNAAAETCDAVGFAIGESLINVGAGTASGYVNIGSFLVCGVLRLIDSDRQSFHAGGGCVSAGVTFWTTSTDPTGATQCSWTFPYPSTWGYTRAIDLRPVFCTAQSASLPAFPACTRPAWRVETLWPDGYDDRTHLTGSTPGVPSSKTKVRNIYFPPGRGFRATTGVWEVWYSIGTQETFTGKITQTITVNN